MTHYSRKAITLWLGVIIALAAALPAFAQPNPGRNYWWFQAVNERNQPITSGLSCQVYTAGTTTPAVVYSDANNQTVKANPFPGDSRGQCAWYMPTSTAVDVVAWHKNGRAFISSLAITEHRVVVDLQGASKVVRIPFATNTALVDTGVQIPVGAVVNDILLEVTVASTTGHIAVGLIGGNTAGFCSGGLTLVGDTAAIGKSLESTGWHRCHAVLATSQLSYNDAVAVAFHSGALISRGAIGTTLTHSGSYFRFPYVANSAANVGYRTKGTVAGHIYLLMQPLGAQ